ncbi:MAG: glycosyl hydrolase family 28 protein [Phycisphaerae bacterium]
MAKITSRMLPPLLTLTLAAAPALADPPLPVIPHVNTIYNVTSYGASTANANNASAIHSAINAASAAGGGTVLIPAGTFLSGPLSLKSNINFQISGTLKALPKASYGSGSTNFISGSHLSNFQVTGTGIIDGQGADWWSAYRSNSSISRPRLFNITNSNTLYFTGVTLQNSPQFNLAMSNNNNVNINGITISNPSNSPNTDGIDASGNNWLIQNCHISTGDDDIVAKPGSAFCSNITITNNTIGAGHGISIGGQSNIGLNNMTVSNCTFNGTTDGLRLKAGTGAGGTVKNVTYSNITMTNVATPIIINSWYNGGDHYGSRELSGGSLHTLANPGDPTYNVNQQNNTNLDPFWDNISFSNITATGASQNVAIIYGLNSIAASPNDPPRNIDSISFKNVSLSGSYGADIYYASNLDLSGLSVTASTGNKFNLFGDTPVGDASGDGKVDLTDLSIVLNNFGKTTPARSLGNFDNSPTIDLTDLSFVLNNMGLSYPNGGLAPGAPTATASPAITSAPEPASLTALLPALLLLRKKRRPA